VEIKHITRLAWEDLPGVESPFFARDLIERDCAAAASFGFFRINGLDDALRDYARWHSPHGLNTESRDSLNWLLDRVESGEYVLIHDAHGATAMGSVLHWSTDSDGGGEGYWSAAPGLPMLMRLEIDECLKKARRSDAPKCSGPERQWWGGLLDGRNRGGGGKGDAVAELDEFVPSSLLASGQSGGVRGVGSDAIKTADETSGTIGAAKGGTQFAATEPVAVSGSRAIDLGASYETGVRGLYGSTSRQPYTAVVNGQVVNGVADGVTRVGGQLTAVEAKFVESWGASLRNPASPIGNTPWAIAEQQAMMDQAVKYSANFRVGVVYHTNSVKFAAHYSQVFKDAGITNFKFVITPVK
jgi:hypothetical protein